MCIRDRAKVADARGQHQHPPWKYPVDESNQKVMVKHTSGSMEPINQSTNSYSMITIELGVNLTAHVYKTPLHGFFVTWLDKAWEGLWLKQGKPKW
eukprot:5731487-Prorocentrum_lima.AAC.1